MPEGDSLKGFYLGFEFHEFRLYSFMSIAKQGSFKDIKAFLDKFKLFRLLAHLPMLKAFRVIPAPMYADMRFAISSFQTSAR